MKHVLGIYSAPNPHWVGDGFPVRSLFSYDSHGKQLSPFLLLDYAGPAHFPPASKPRGVGQHPHRGFETVTIVYKGEVAHQDSSGGGGLIGPGDVQWMTAGAGIVHEEFHSAGFTQSGGELEMVQLWVNLPARDKMTPPRYQAITDQDIPAIPLANQAGTLRVIAGDFENHRGPAQTFTPMHVWDIALAVNGICELEVPEDWHTAVVVLNGTVQLNSNTVMRDAQMAVLGPKGQHLCLEANGEARVLLLSGEPIDEPIVGYGPFVMNSQQEIREAISDFQRGTFGRIDN
ncbi:pirin family protein [Alcanivorax sp. IL2]|uniref:pirin family protein n=1 Tax=Alcanivorax sp. IL2 TaxID=3396310 RepID=UPI0039C3DA4D